MWRKMMAVTTVAGFVLAGSAAGRVHTVRRGETLSGIGQRYSVSVGTLAAANGIPDPDFVMAGRALSIPDPRPAPGRGSPATSVATATDVVPAGSPAPSAGALRETVVRMPPARLAAARPAGRIAVPPERAALRTAFLRFSRLAGVPSDLVMALAWQESGWQRHRVSSTNAVGVMQLMPDTVEFVSTQLLRTKPLDPRDPVANIRMGTRFLRYLLDSNGGNVDRALASYYQGLRSVRERGMFPETERFVANVKALRGRL